ncbi:MAG: Hpt domain-containing protein, partial [Spirochaetes bacterium]|nr:Hpt domain-containing protein [Spirochaetota bacterium]
MNTERIEKLLKKISMSLLEYEDGDMMLISDLIDDMSELNVLLEAVKPARKIINIISTILEKLLKGEQITNQENMFSDGIDLIASIIRSTKKVKGKIEKLDELLENDINNYENTNKQYISNKRKRPEKKPLPNIIQKKDSPHLPIDSESFKIFLVEAEERIVQAQDYILKLEKELDNKSLINNLFRIFHTIKGECGFLRLASLGELAHNIENILDLIRNNEIKNSPDIIDILLNGIDYAGNMLKALKSGNIIVFNEIRIDNFVQRIHDQTNKARISIGEILRDEGKLTNGDVIRILQEQKESSYTKKFGEIAIEDHLITEEDIEESIRKQKKYNIEPEKKTQKVDSIIKVK